MQNYDDLTFQKPQIHVIFNEYYQLNKSAQLIACDSSYVCEGRRMRI